MLRKLGAVLVAVGLCVPHDMAAPITVLWASWSDLSTLVFVGVPVLVAVAYVLHAFVPPLARFHERNGPALHGAFRAVFFVLAGGSVHRGLTGGSGPWWLWVAGLLVPGAILYWEQQRGTKAERLPLLLLVSVGVPVVTMFLGSLAAVMLSPGAWVLMVGYVVAVVAEMRALRGAARVTHGG